MGFQVSLSHINLLELTAVVELSRRVAKTHGSCRVLSFVDSAFVRGACSKRRSASNGITELLRRFCSICVAAGLYFTTPFCPTRLNPADDPTRCRGAREAMDDAWIDDYSQEELYLMATLRPLRRWTSNWISLVIKLLGPEALSFEDRSLFRSSPFQPPLLFHLNWTWFLSWLSR